LQTQFVEKNLQPKEHFYAQGRHFFITTKIGVYVLKGQNFKQLV